ncbi:MAG: hypothetical protein Q9178_007950 [Gyalolechia marmorata]
MNIVVCTHQVLLDALIHGFVHTEKMPLLVFDEAHHCVRSHPANKTMQNFYHAKRREGRRELPNILGLTASPVVRKEKTIEQNLSAISKTPKQNREELQRFVHGPDMAVLVHPEEQALPPRLLKWFSQLYSNLDIEQDPYVASLRSEDVEKYFKVRLSRKTYCQDQMKRFFRIAIERNNELGSWTSDLHICLCILGFQAQRQAAFSILEHMNEGEKGQEKALLEWQNLEAVMKEKYMDDMRHLEGIEKLEAAGHGHRQFLIESTGTLLRVEIGEGVVRVKDVISVATANEITKTLLTSVFPTRMKEVDGGFPLLFTPGETWAIRKAGWSICKTWHEGYLSRVKDHVVSNGRLAMAAQEIALDKYILTKASTVSSLTLAERNSMLLRAACDSPQLPTTPLNFAILETLIGHTSVCKRLLLEIVTYPSHLSIPNTPSYQRLEYLGDAILDYLATTTIFSFSALNATRDRFAALEPVIDAAFGHSLVYPWQAFAAFAPEKVFSDMIEAVLGAV